MKENEETELNFDIVMKDETYDKLFCLMENIKTINAGNEIGAFLTGKWSKLDDGTLKLLVDRFIIPKQEVAGSAVDISPEGSIDAIQQLTKKDKPIIGHWHIHPFANGTTDWSGGDESKIKDWMLPGKGRKIFIFMLSSLDKLKARVEVVTETKYPVDNFVISQLDEYDDLPVRREHTKENKAYLKELTKTIKEKVTEIAPVQPIQPKGGFSYNIWGNPHNKSKLKYEGKDMGSYKPQAVLELDKGPHYLITRKDSFVRIKIQNKLLDYMEYSNMDITTLIGVPTDTKEKSTLTMYGFMCNTDAEAALLETTATEELETLQQCLAVYEDETKDYVENASNGTLREYHY